MPGVYDVVDVTSHEDMDVLYNQLVALGGTTVLRYESLSNADKKMGTDILGRAGPRGASVVRIWGHGLPGVVAIAAGTTPEFVTDHHAGFGVRAQFAPETFSKTFASTLIQESLKPLAEAMSRDARLELHGCAIGHPPLGDLFCKDLAKKLACWVWASPVAQYGLKWKPPVLAFLPNGTVLNNLTPPPLTP
jgi:hypothetical protein